MKEFSIAAYLAGLTSGWAILNLFTGEWDFSVIFNISLPIIAMGVFFKEHRIVWW